MRISAWIGAVALFALVAGGSGFVALQLMKGEAAQEVERLHVHAAAESGMIAIPKRAASGWPEVRPAHQEMPQAVMPPCVIGQCQDV